MSSPDRVFRIMFRLRGKHYQVILTGPEADQAGEDLAALSPQLEVLGIEDLGLRSAMDDDEFERLRREDRDLSE
jgi:hypothetical protein